VAIDTEQLADHLRTLIADEPRRVAMGAAGRAKVRGRFRASAVVRQYEALWDELAAAAASLENWRTPAPVTPVASRPGADPAALAPSWLFHAYPTGFLSPDDSVAAVPGVAIDPPYSDVAVLLHRPLLEAIRDRCAAPARVRDVVRLAPLEARGWFAVMWLLKYGVLRVSAHG
jgi:hypothetical protein